jgi:hypothetical protein
MKTNARVQPGGTGWGQLGCPSCPSWHSESFQVGQRKLLKSCDCPSCPRCPSEISILYRAVGDGILPPCDKDYKQIEIYLGHLAHVGQVTGMIMEKLSQEGEISRTELGQKAGEKHSKAQGAGAVGGSFPSLVGLFLPLALVFSKPLLQQDSDSFRSAVDPIANAEVIQPLNELFISHEKDFRFISGHSVLIPRSGGGCKRDIDNNDYIGYMRYISMHITLDRRF